MIILYTTVQTNAQASQLSEALLNNKLAACVQQTTIQSQYLWQGELEQTTEIQLCIKSRAANTQGLMDWISANHPYETPEIIVVKPKAVSEPYKMWVYSVTNPIN